DWIEITGSSPTAVSCALSASTAAVSTVGEVSQTLSSIYPNPTHGNTTINVTLAKNEQAVIRLFDAQGKVVKDLGVVKSLTGGTQQLTYDFSGQIPGLYLVSVMTNKGAISTSKLLVE
uniref:T9SS type A sorting domain-containing protein n=1 Tax=Chitinophaga sp. TaxID=1869181 RepID=UPI0031DF700E